MPCCLMMECRWRFGGWVFCQQAHAGEKKGTALDDHGKLIRMVPLCQNFILARNMMSEVEWLLKSYGVQNND